MHALISTPIPQPNGIPESALVFNDWEVRDEACLPPPSLVVQLRRFAYVLPWFRFAYAEGDDSSVLIVIGAHLIKVEGSGLSALLGPIAGHRVVRLIEPSENEAKFGVRGRAAESVSGPQITSISVDVPEEGD